VKLGTEASLAPLVTATQDADEEVQIRATDGLVNNYLPGYVAHGALSGPLTRGVRQVKAYFSTRNDQVIGPEVTVRPDVQEAIAGVILHGATLEAKANAARAAGILRDKPAGTALQSGLRSKDTQFILESLVALQKIGDPTAGQGVSFLANDLNDRVQMTALETIGILHTTSGAPDVRSSLKRARDIKIRRAAINALALLGLPEDRATFSVFASDPDVQLRTSGIEGLARIREPEDTETLRLAYNEKNGDWRIHLAAAFGLVNEGDVKVDDLSPLRYLVDNLNPGNHPEVVEPYLKELARRDDVRKALMPLLPSGSNDQKMALCRILASSGNEDVIPALDEMVKDINPDVAATAAKCLQTVKSPKS
jgi:HEAT repeat protein